MNVKKEYILGEKSEWKLRRLLMEDGSVEFLLTSPGDDPRSALRTKGDTEVAIKEATTVFCDKLARIDKTKRANYIKGLIDKSAEISDRENDKQDPLPMGDGAGDEEAA